MPNYDNDIFEKSVDVDVDMDFEDNLRERIKAIFAAKSTTPSAMAGNGTALHAKFNRQLCKGAHITFDVISFTINIFPDVSAEWLLRGEGPMIRPKRDGGVTVNAPKNTGAVVTGDNNSVANTSKEDPEATKFLMDLVTSQQATIASQQQVIAALTSTQQK